MYRSDLRPRERSGAIIAVAIIHAALLLAILNISGKLPRPTSESVFQLLNFNRPKPPPPPPQELRQPKLKKEGGAAPPNIRSEATPVAAPKPRIVLPPTPQIAASPTPRQGAAPTQGASNMVGPGTGAGGVGSGTGNGLGGNGPGDGGGVAVNASLIRGISGGDYPPGIRERWPRGAVVYVRLRVEPSGRPSRCDVMRSFGDPLTDQWTCALLMQRSSFRPALDARGVPVATWFGYKQVDIGG